MRKRGLMLTVAMMLLLAVLAGCGSNNGNDPAKRGERQYGCTGG